MSKAELGTFLEAINLVTQMLKPRMQTDAVYVELATAIACLMRARRLLIEREGVAS